MLWGPLLKGQFPMALLRRRKNIRIKTAKNHPQESCLRAIKIFLTVARRASNPIKIFPFFRNCFHQPAFVSEFSEKQYCKFLSMLDILQEISNWGCNLTHLQFEEQMPNQRSLPPERTWWRSLPGPQRIFPHIQEDCAPLQSSLALYCNLVKRSGRGFSCIIDEVMIGDARFEISATSDNSSILIHNFPNYQNSSHLSNRAVHTHVLSHPNQTFCVDSVL